MKHTILVTGGAGYIGSHVVKLLLEQQAGRIVVLDDLSTGSSDLVHSHAKLIVGDIRDRNFVQHLLKQEQINTVMHLAAKTSVPESIRDPAAYYDQNTLGTFSLLQACVHQKVQHFIFSSTAAVYGQPRESIVREDAPTLPINPYGTSKLMCEHMIRDIAAAHALSYVNLRYFNVAGADPSGTLGQKSHSAEHLIKVAIDTALGKRATMPIYGNDYPTQDGTCVRDFIHVTDIAKAHVDALYYLRQNGQSVTLNCGYGKGYSVKEVIKTVEKIANTSIRYEYHPRRLGDSPCVVAANEKIQRVLKWQPKFNDLTLMIKTAYAWSTSPKSTKAALLDPIA